MSLSSFEVRKLAKKKTTKKRKKSSPKKSKPKSYFIGVDDPTGLRRIILEPNREVVHFLQSYEEFRRIKQEKTQTILGLKEDLKEIRSDILKLKKLLPGKRKEISKKRIIEEIKEEKVSVPKRPKIETEPGELEELEKELAAIEQKLGTLD